MTLLTGRLQEIANEATEYCKTQPREIAGSMWEKKFAELIIKECCDLVREIDAMEIRKYFGIKL